MLCLSLLEGLSVHETAADLDLELPGVSHGDGALMQLMAPALSEKRAITFAGQSFDSPGGYPSGQKISLPIRKESSGGISRYQIQVPKASGAILEINENP